MLLRLVPFPPGVWVLDVRYVNDVDRQINCSNVGVDINTQQSFEALNQRAVAVVIDPVQSVYDLVLAHSASHAFIPSSSGSREGRH